MTTPLLLDYSNLKKKRAKRKRTNSQRPLNWEIYDLITCPCPVVEYQLPKLSLAKFNSLALRNAEILG